MAFGHLLDHFNIPDSISIHFTNREIILLALETCTAFIAATNKIKPIVGLMLHFIFRMDFPLKCTMACHLISTNYFVA